MLPDWLIKARMVEGFALLGLAVVLVVVVLVPVGLLVLDQVNAITDMLSNIGRISE